MRNHHRLLWTAAALLLVPDYWATAQAQQLSVEEIVVTARKREERLLEIPLAITAFTAQDIEDAGFRDLADISLQTAGLDFFARSGGRPGRVDSPMSLRGVSGGQDHLQPTSVFIDGIFLLGAANTIGIQDLERVEVIKGPQSAFFGRNTFAGAINFITKNPDLNEYVTKVDASAATYDKFDFNILSSGPLVEGKLGFQLNARLMQKGAEWTATDGGPLGEETSKFISGVLYGEPTDNLSFKLRAYYQKDEDSAPVIGLIRGRFTDTCSGTSVERLDTDGNPATFFPVRSLCGPVPKFGYIEPITGRTLLSTETSMKPPLFAQVRPGFDTTGARFFGAQPNYLIDVLGGDAGDRYLGKNVPDRNSFGMTRNQIRLAFNADYEFDNGYVVNVLAGYNDARMSMLRDYDSTDGPWWYAVDPKFAQDWSLEARINSPQDKRLRWLVGTTLYDQTFLNSGAGGLLVQASFFSTAVGPRLTELPPTAGNEAKVAGIYAAVSYDITDEITLDLENRYLVDKRTLQQGGIDVSSKFKEWTPRVILSYQPSEDTNIYAQFSRGTLPGTTNGLVAGCSMQDFSVTYTNPITGLQSTTSECGQIEEQLPPGAFSIAPPAQRLNSYEAGWKQTLMDGRARFNLIGWYYDWINRPFGLSIQWVRDAANIADRDGIPNDFPNSLGVTVPGSQNLWGLEFESGFAITENWDAQLNVAWSGNEFTEFQSTGAAQLLGFSNLKGLEIGGYPEWSGNLATTYTDTLRGEWDWYGRADFLYRGSYFTESQNLGRGDDYVITNARLGLQREDLRVEFFIRNLFQTQTWRRASGGLDFSHPTFSFNAFRGVTVVPQEKRTFGIRTNITF